MTPFERRWGAGDAAGNLEPRPALVCCADDRRLPFGHSRRCPGRHGTVPGQPHVQAHWTRMESGGGRMNLLLFGLGLVSTVVAAAAIRWSRQHSGAPRKEAEDPRPDA